MKTEYYNLIPGKLYRVTLGYGTPQVGIYLKIVPKSHLEFLYGAKVYNIFGYQYSNISYEQLN